MAGKKGRSGRQRTIPSLVNEAIDKVDKSLPELFGTLIELAKNGDREALMYLIDRRLGKPKQHTDLNIEGINADVIAIAYRQAYLEGQKEFVQIKLLEEGKDAKEV